MADPVSAIGGAIESFFRFLTKRTEKIETIEIIDNNRQVEKAVEYAEKYIRRNNEVYDVTDKDLKKLEDKFFKYN